MWYVSRSGICVDFRFPLCCRWSSSRWLHKRWWFSLVLDPITYVPWSVLFGKGKRCDLRSRVTQLHFRFLLLCRYRSRDQSQLPPWCWHAELRERVRGRTVETCAGLVTQTTFDQEAVSKLVFFLFLHAPAVTTQET